MLRSLKSRGKGAIILPHGVLFRGNKEADIRRNLVQRGLIKGIIGLPANLFFGTGIPACILVIDKENAHARTGIFMIDASNGFIKDGNKNRLRAQDIHKIVNVFNRQMVEPRYSRMVPVAEIGSPANDFNLNIPRYIDSSEPEDLQDLDAHLNGGIPVRDIDALDNYWAVFPTLRKALFKNNGRKGYCEARVETQQVKPTILAYPEFTAYAERLAGVFAKWRKAHDSLLNGLKAGAKPKEVIGALSEHLLERFSDLPLLDRYDVYQRLMDYWAEVMQDDVYLIAADGWLEAARPRAVVEDKEKKIKETPDLVAGRRKYKMDLIPPALIVARWFADERAAIDDLQVKQEAAGRELEEFVEEHTGEEGLLEDAANDKGNVNKGGITARLKAIQNEADSDEERDALTRCLKLIEAEAKASKAVRDAEAALDEKVLAKYPKLTEAEIKSLVVDDKWFASIQTAIADEVQRLTQRLAGRVRELAERYETPLPQLTDGVAELQAKVNRHLITMGVTT